MGTAAALAIATLASEDLAAGSAAVLATRGDIDAATATLAVTVGIYAGDLLLFVCGRTSARVRVLQRWIARRWSSDQLSALSARLDRRLALTILGSRFLPGSRLPMYVAAGMFSRRPLAFAVYSLIAVSLWTPLLVGGVLLAGTGFASWTATYVRWAPAVVLLVGMHLLSRHITKERHT